jgi:hypothetical protein
MPTRGSHGKSEGRQVGAVEPSDVKKIWENQFGEASPSDSWWGPLKISESQKNKSKIRMTPWKQRQKHPSSEAGSVAYSRRCGPRATPQCFSVGGQLLLSGRAARSLKQQVLSQAAKFGPYICLIVAFGSPWSRPYYKWIRAVSLGGMQLRCTVHNPLIL